MLLKLKFMTHPKTVFIAHPISGNEEENLRKVLEICKELNSQGIIPIFPPHSWRQYMEPGTDSKYWSGLVNEEYFRRGMVDEVWLYGETISDGMKKEIRLAVSYGIPIIPKNPRIEEIFNNMLP